MHCVFKVQVPIFLEAAVVVIPLAEAGPEIEVLTPTVAVVNSKLLLNKHRNSSHSRNSNSLIQTRISLIISGLLSELNGNFATNVASGENILRMNV